MHYLLPEPACQTRLCMCLFAVVLFHNLIISPLCFFRVACLHVHKPSYESPSAPLSYHTKSRGTLESLYLTHFHMRLVMTFASMYHTRKPYVSENSIAHVLMYSLIYALMFSHRRDWQADFLQCVGQNDIPTGRTVSTYIFNERLVL